MKSRLLFISFIAIANGSSGLSGDEARNSATPDSYFCSALNFNGKLLLTRDSLWDVETGRQLRHLHVPKPEFVTSAGFSPDSRLAFTATARNVGAEIIFGGAVQLWDVATGDETVRLVQKEGYVFDAQFSPDGKRILTALSGTPS